MQDITASADRPLLMSGVKLNNLRRLVIKIGSSLLITRDGRLDRDWLSGLAEDVAALRSGNRQVLIVSSGHERERCCFQG